MRKLLVTFLVAAGLGLGSLFGGGHGAAFADGPDFMPVNLPGDVSGGISFNWTGGYLEVNLTGAPGFTYNATFVLNPGDTLPANLAEYVSSAEAPAGRIGGYQTFSMGGYITGGGYNTGPGANMQNPFGLNNPTDFESEPAINWNFESEFQVNFGGGGGAW